MWVEGGTLQNLRIIKAEGRAVGQPDGGQSQGEAQALNMGHREPPRTEGAKAGTKKELSVELFALESEMKQVLCSKWPTNFHY